MTTMKTNPISSRHRTRLVLVLMAGVMLTSFGADMARAQTCPHPLSWNGYCPETTPRAYEPQMHNFVFKASHNSYDRSETLGEQIDDYNVWMLELDCWWLDNNIYVRHLCGGGNGDTLASQLNEIVAAQTDHLKFTLIYMEMKYDCTNDDWQCGFLETCHAWPADVRSQFETRIRTAVVDNWIYTADEWDSIDNKQWPSHQELIRRGKHYAFILDERGNGDGGNSFFFEVGQGGGYDTLVNHDGGCDGGGSPDAVTPTARYLHRAYPGSSCAGLCSEQNGGYWNDGVTLGFNFVATNCVSDSHTFDVRTHSPDPMWVVGAATGRDQWGTHRFPYYSPFGILAATLRATTPAVDIRIEGGTYAFPVNTTFTGRGVLKSNNGTVTLSAQ